MFTSKDIEQFKAKGISVDEIEKQIKCFKEGFPFINLIAPATPGNGILAFEEGRIRELVALFESESKNRRVIKFVPASGAATRMFKSLFEFYHTIKDADDPQKVLETDKSFNSPCNFIRNIRNFAFYNDLKKVLQKNGLDIDHLLENHDYGTIISYFLDDKGMGYGNLPKGLLKFHEYPDGARLSIEEHLVEGAAYARNDKDQVHLHFTVSPEHLEKFKSTISQVGRYYEDCFHVEYIVDFSIQKPSTDTIAVDLNNEPFRDAHGNIMFRPGGHGSLIENLNDIQGDIIFIKNIDNVVPDHLKPETFKYKKVLGGLLIELHNRISGYLHYLDKEDISRDTLNEIREFANNELSLKIDSTGHLSTDELISFLKEKLNRPIRVCGMVRNEGEPGGGPFWVKNKEGAISLQIVEGSQIDMKDQKQKEILRASTHFNPVDLVCSLKNYKGQKFNLREFIDPDTGFISLKSKDGRDLKAQELPGLWNGAMADWTTIFVEVPIITFNPVKTINDLLREQHQMGGTQ